MKSRLLAVGGLLVTLAANTHAGTNGTTSADGSSAKQCCVGSAGTAASRCYGCSTPGVSCSPGLGGTCSVGNLLGTTHAPPKPKAK